MPIGEKHTSALGQQGDGTMTNNSNDLSNILKRRRLMMALTLHELAKLADVSPSYLGRIERGERFPSASILRRIARPLGFTEVELFAFAGYLPYEREAARESTPLSSTGNIDAYVASVLASEPVTTQRAVIGILNILKAIGREQTVQDGELVGTFK